MKKLFGTDGIRGIANEHPMTSDIAMKVGAAAAHIFKTDSRRPKIVIGKDTRLSGYMIEYAITAGISSGGVDVLLLGPIPTPGIAFITTSMRADAGIVISASHNTYEYNGIKIFARDGFKLPDRVEEHIEQLILTGEIEKLSRPPATDIAGPNAWMMLKAATLCFSKILFPENSLWKD